MSENCGGKFLWELLEMEAPNKFFVDGKERPAFLLFPKYHWASRKGHTLYMNGVGIVNTFTSEKKALKRLREIIENANFKISVYRMKKYGRDKGKRFLFADTIVDRVDKAKLKNPMKVFEIEEWSHLEPT